MSYTTLAHVVKIVRRGDGTYHFEEMDPTQANVDIVKDATYGNKICFQGSHAIRMMNSKEDDDTKYEIWYTRDTNKDHAAQG